MKLLSAVWCFILFFSLSAIPRAFSHVDPPVMKLTIDFSMPIVKEKVTIRITLKGTNTDIPLIGAKIKIILIDSEGNRVNSKATAGKTAGEYLDTIAFPRPGMWKMRVEVMHMNELDFRVYMIHVMKSAHSPRKAMTDETRLAMDKNAAHQFIPPLMLLEGYVLIVLLLLATVTLIKKAQEQG
ncbi:MAG: hypothetical protein ACE5DO_05720 [Desulfobacterales bacterium]